jgi:hypothetical protein
MAEKQKNSTLSLEEHIKSIEEVKEIASLSISGVGR